MGAAPTVEPPGSPLCPTAGAEGVLRVLHWGGKPPHTAFPGGPRAGRLKRAAMAGLPPSPPRPVRHQDHPSRSGPIDRSVHGTGGLGPSDAVHSCSRGSRTRGHEGSSARSSPLSRRPNFLCFCLFTTDGHCGSDRPRLVNMRQDDGADMG